VVKIRDQQRLELEHGPDGRLAAMTMVSRPALLVPGGKYLPMGDVRFRVAAAGTPAAPHCKARRRRLDRALHDEGSSGEYLFPHAPRCTARCRLLEGPCMAGGPPASGLPGARGALAAGGCSWACSEQLPAHAWHALARRCRRHRMHTALMAWIQHTRSPSASSAVS